MVAEHKIDRQKLISGHNPVLTEIATDSPLTVGNGELAFTAECRRYTRNIRNSRCVQCHNGDGTRNR
jgi:hypothetical protein